MFFKYNIVTLYSVCSQRLAFIFLQNFIAWICKYTRKKRDCRNAETSWPSGYDQRIVKTMTFKYTVNVKITIVTSNFKQLLEKLVFFTITSSLLWSLTKDLKLYYLEFNIIEAFHALLLKIDRITISGKNVCQINIRNNSDPDSLSYQNWWKISLGHFKSREVTWRFHKSLEWALNTDVEPSILIKILR